MGASSGMEVSSGKKTWQTSYDVTAEWMHRRRISTLLWTRCLLLSEACAWHYVHDGCDLTE